MMSRSWPSPRTCLRQGHGALWEAVRVEQHTHLASGDRSARRSVEDRETAIHDVVRNAEEPDRYPRAAASLEAGLVAAFTFQSW